jgi:hypothetical protein
LEPEKFNVLVDKALQERREKLEHKRALTVEVKPEIAVAL